jgi:hypothetical protein
METPALSARWANIKEVKQEMNKMAAENFIFSNY